MGDDMGNRTRIAIRSAVILITVFLASGPGFAIDGTPPTNAPTTRDSGPSAVVINYSVGSTKLDTLINGVTLFTDKAYPLRDLPAEMDGLSFSVRPAGLAADLSLTVPANTTVYVLTEDDGNDKPLMADLAANGWEKLPTEAHFLKRTVNRPLALYRQHFAAATNVTISGAGSDGMLVAAPILALPADDTQTVQAPGPQPATQPIASGPATGAQPTTRDSNVPVVKVAYASGETTLVPLQSGVVLYPNRTYTISDVPAELAGTTYTRRPAGVFADVELDVPAGATVYLLVVDTSRSAKLMAALPGSGWTKIPDAHFFVNAKTVHALAVYKQDFAAAKQVVIAGKEADIVFVAAQHLSVQPFDSSIVVQAPAPVPSPEPAAPARASRGGRAPAPTASGRAGRGATANDAAISGPTTRVASQQTSINCLEVVQTETGGVVGGQASEVILTVTRGDSPTMVTATFATKTGSETALTMDEALRYIHLTYPNWYADKAEITFEDKYTPHDGGSIGAAVATLFRSAIEGISIDPNVAMTGDISANGKVRAIGGVSAKLRGAVAANCAIVVMPMDNYGQLLDTLVYSGPAAISDVQILGISDVDEAIAAVRSDRDPKLAGAVELFSKVHDAMAASPEYIHSAAAQNQLTEILQMAPRHLSAKLLLMYSQRKQPTTLSTTASLYYTFQATQIFASFIQPPAKPAPSRGRANVPSTPAMPDIPGPVVRDSLVALAKLRPMVDPHALPLLDAMSSYLTGWLALDNGHGSVDEIEKRRQDVLYALTKLETNSDLMQKMLQEGI
jgi:hypothetical protein